MTKRYRTEASGRPPRSLCLLRLSSIGDVCHATAVVGNIRRAFPDLALTWVVGKTEYGLLRGLDGVEFVVFDKSAGARAFLDLRRRLSGRRFDVLFHMQRAFRASLASLFIRAKRRIGWDRERARELQWLFTSERVRPQERPHVIDGFFAFAERIGVHGRELTWEIPVPEEDRRWAETTLPWDRIFTMNAGASDPRRCWRAESYAAVAAHAQRRHGCRVVLTGGPSPFERELADSIMAAMERLGCDVPLDLVGATSLKQLLAVLERSSLLLAPDTGPLHMAAAAGTRAVGLYGHSNPARTGPLLSMDLVVSRYEQAVRREYGKGPEELRWGTRARGADVMELIPVDEVLEAVDRGLDSSGK